VPDERERLLELTARHLLEHGVLDLRLRTLGEAIGSSHRVLLYYFGSREELIAEALEEAARLSSVRDAFLAGPDDGAADVYGEFVRVWTRVSAREQLPFTRLFLQVVALALHDARRYEKFLDDLPRDWAASYTRYLERQGMPSGAAADLAAEIVGLQRGLQLELAIGSAPEMIDRAFLAAARRWSERVDGFR
jgi:AcrR family transcriptional regulator